MEENLNDDGFTYVVERNDQLVTLQNIIHNPPRIAQVLPKSAAISAGLKKGDLILSLNSQKINTFKQIKNAVETSKGERIKVEYWRNREVGITWLTPCLMCQLSQADLSVFIG